MTSTLTSTVTSADGTTISYERVGTGPAVVVLPGTMTTGDAWRLVAERLAGEFTLFLVDRRFYGASGPGPAPTTFARETADVRAMIDVAGGSAHVLGHSYGAILALHAALADPRGIRSLLLYEAPVAAPGPRVADVLTTYRAQLSAGDPLGAITTFLTTVVGLPPEQMAMLAGADPDDAPPTSDELASLAESLLHDIESLATDPREIADWGAITVPTLLMAGGRSWGLLVTSSAELRAVLPGADSVTWPEQAHFANMFDPALVADTIREYLQRHP